jgi:preprotein translocase subunit SecE
VASPAPRRAQEAPRVEARRGGVLGFVRESAAELQKVEWPSRAQVTTGTVVVIIAVVIVGFYLWVADQAFKNLVEKVII